MPVQFFFCLLQHRAWLQWCLWELGEGVTPVSCCICEEAIEESSWAQAPRHSPEGSVKAARRFTIAPQQGDGDWKTSIREAGMDVKWLGPISPGVRRPREGIYELEKQMMTGTKASQRVRGGCWKPICSAHIINLRLQLKWVQKHQAKLWCN